MTLKDWIASQPKAWMWPFIVITNDKLKSCVKESVLAFWLIGVIKLRQLYVVFNKGLKDALQTLGRSMAENIQVLECALSHKCSLAKEEPSIASREKSEYFPKKFLNGKGHGIALSALAE